MDKESRNRGVVEVQCECGEILHWLRKPWECGSKHLDCRCGDRLKVRVLVDTENRGGE